MPLCDLNSTRIDTHVEDIHHLRRRGQTPKHLHILPRDLRKTGTRQTYITGLDPAERRKNRLLIQQAREERRIENWAGALNSEVVSCTLPVGLGTKLKIAAYMRVSKKGQ